MHLVGLSFAHFSSNVINIFVTSFVWFEVCSTIPNTFILIELTSLASHSVKKS
jgi:hypothetical protein